MFLCRRDKNEILIKKDISTQTEHCCLIRSTQSCPVQKKQLITYFHLNFPQPTTNKNMSKNKLKKSLPNSFSGTIYRKASDNLIYEKCKGSHSPSYISSPERFRWKCLSPTKGKRENIQSSSKSGAGNKKCLNTVRQKSDKTIKINNRKYYK